MEIAFNIHADASDPEHPDKEDIAVDIIVDGIREFVPTLMHGSKSTA
jgi:hypothetical protein